MKESDSDFNYLWSESINAVFFFFLVSPLRECRERVSPPRVWSSPFTASVPKLWKNMPETRKQTPYPPRPPSLVCVPTAKWGWNKGQCLPDHTRQMFECSQGSWDAKKSVYLVQPLFFFFVGGQCVWFRSQSQQQDEDDYFKTASSVLILWCCCSYSTSPPHWFQQGSGRRNVQLEQQETFLVCMHNLLLPSALMTSCLLVSLAVLLFS